MAPGPSSARSRRDTCALPPRIAAEALGTGLLVATVAGSGIMAEKLAGGNVAIGLLGNTIPAAAILAVLSLALGPSAHFNPAELKGVFGPLFRGSHGRRRYAGQPHLCDVAGKVKNPYERR